MIQATTHGFTLSWDNAEAVYDTSGALVYAHYRRRGRLVLVHDKHTNKLAYFRRQGEMEMREGSPLRHRAIAAMNEARRQVNMPALTDEETGETK